MRETERKQEIKCKKRKGGGSGLARKPGKIARVTGSRKGKRKQKQKQKKPGL